MHPAYSIAMSFWMAAIALIAIILGWFIMQCLLIVLYSVLAISLTFMHLECVEHGTEETWFD